MMTPNRSDDTKPRKPRLDKLLDLSDDDHAEWLRHKREDVAIALTGMLCSAGISRAELARKLEWKPSRVSRALSGHENLTLNTLAEIVNAGGLDFDIMLRSRSQCRALQPWEGANIGVVILDLHHQMLDKLADAQSNCFQAKAILNSANEVAQATFRRGNYWRAQQALPQADTQSYQYSEEQHAPIRCKA